MMLREEEGAVSEVRWEVAEWAWVDVIDIVIENGARTRLLILRKRLIMLPPQFRPLRELILRARSVHLALEADHFPAALVLRAHS